LPQTDEQRVAGARKQQLAQKAAKKAEKDEAARANANSGKVNGVPRWGDDVEI